MNRIVSAERDGDHSFVTSWLGPKSVVVDLGMNQGVFAQTLRARYGCRVLGVEPDPELALANQARGLECTHAAIAPEPGTVAFRVDRGDRTASHVVAPDADGAIRVPALPLGRFLDERGVREGTLLKVDIEGAELALFEREPPEVFDRFEQITVEFHAFLDPGQRPRIMAILDAMAARGFHWIDFSLVLMDVLLVNTKRRALGPLDRKALLAAKYVNGVKRRLSAWRTARRRP